MSPVGFRLRFTVAVAFTALSLVGTLARTNEAMALQASTLPDPLLSQALILLHPGADVDAVIEAIEVTGGHVTHVFPPVALIAEVSAEAPPSTNALGQTDGRTIRAVYRQAMDKAALNALTGEARRAAEVWNALLNPEPPADGMQSLDGLGEELVGDAMVPPASQTVRAQTGDLTPGYTETSEYFIGRVAVGIVLPESDGSVDGSTEDWTEEERALVQSEITEALDWWASLEPKAHLTFVYDDGTLAPTPTSYEPITRPYRDQSLWITEVMNRKGYTGHSCFDQVRSYNNAMRDEYDTDWAFTIFVVDSSNDSDNRLSDGFFAYAYLGGPFTVITYGNNGYGPHNMDAVVAHEVGHVFLALDQYSAARQPCTLESGYLGVENQNSQYRDCASDVPSIMRGQTWPYRDGAVDEYARGQIGWRDSDGDGILDPVDTALSVNDVGYQADAERPNILTFAGSVQDDPHPSPLRRNTTINTIERIQYRVTGGEWMDAEPADGAFDSYAEDFGFTTPLLPTGELDIELRVVDSAGNELVQSVATVSIVDPVDAILDTTLSRVAQQDQDEESPQIIYSGQGTSATGHIAAVYYRVDSEPWQLVDPVDGAFDEPQEDFAFTVDVTNLSPGTHQVEAYSIDDDGNIETSPASDLIVVEHQTQYVFVPLVVRAR